MESLSSIITSLPHDPGIYRYYDASGTVIYVGKAVDLKRRVSSYFQNDAHHNEKTRQMVSEIVRIETTSTTSEFEALLLEAKLIREYLPKYNVISRDDKSPLYVVITLSEDLPRIFTARKHVLSQYSKNKNNAVFGPFQSGLALRTILRQLRSIVPFCTQKERTGKPCFYTHLNLCNPCPSVISKLPEAQQSERIHEYRKNMFRLKAIFDGKLQSIRDVYEKAMHEYADALQFEKARDMKQRLDALYALSEYRYDPMVFLERGAADIYADQLSELLKILRHVYPKLEKLHRIECFDMSQLYGTSPVGSMVVLTDGKSDNGSYRRFKVHATVSTADTNLMLEVLRRRLTHSEWPTPDFVLVDGGKPQVRIANKAITEAGLSIPFAGLAKRHEELILPYGTTFRIIRLPLNGQAIKVLQRIRDEAHRFAITYHRVLRKKKFEEFSNSSKV